MVAACCLVQTNKVKSIESQNRSLSFGGEGEHFCIGYALVGSPGVQGSQYVVPHFTKQLDHPKIKILVGIESSGHGDLG